MFSRFPAAVNSAQRLEFIVKVGRRFVSGRMDALKPVIVDEGRCKYVQIKVHDPKDDDKSVMLVRALKHAAWHADIFEPEDEALHKQGLDAECLGGGRIERSTANKTIHIFGYSQAYGQPDHNITCELIKKEFPDYKVTWSNEGY